MRRLPGLNRRRAILAGLLAVVMSMGATAAWAYWLTSGVGSGSATTGSFAAPTNPTATYAPGASSVSVSWTASAGSPTPTGYFVTRVRTSDNVTSAACGTSAGALTTATSCTDLAVPNGTYRYSVTAVYRSWTATSGLSNAVTVAVATATATTTTLSSSSNPSVVGQTVTYTAAVTPSGSTGTVTFKDGAATITCTGGSQTLSAGQATCSLVYNTVGPHLITAVYNGDPTHLTSTSAALNQVVNSPSATKLLFSVQPGNASGGAVLATQPRVVIADASGNVVTSDSSTPVTLALTSAGGATLSCTGNPVTASAGLATFAGCKVDKAGTYTLTATAGSLTSAQSVSFTISVGPATRLAFVNQPGGGTAGATWSSQPSVVVQDAGGNTVTASPVAVTLTPSAASVTCTANPATTSSGIATFSGCSMTKAGSFTLTAASGALTSSTSASFLVTAAAINKLLFTDQTGTATCATGSVIVGNAGTFSSYVSTTDVFGNIVARSATLASTVTLTKASGDGNTPSPTTLTIAATASTTSGASAMTIPNGNPADSVYTASISGSGLTPASCTVRKN